MAASHLQLLLVLGVCVCSTRKEDNIKQTQKDVQERHTAKLLKMVVATVGQTCQRENKSRCAGAEQEQKVLARCGTVVHAGLLCQPVVAEGMATLLHAH